MARITFYGAAGTVTGSRHLLDIRGQRVLIDSGLFQGKKANRLKNWEDFPVDPGSIDKILITHAHIDHTGYLPRLVKQGFTGPVYCTHATQELLKVLLMDSAHLQEEDARWANKKGFSRHKKALPLYDSRDAEDTLQLLIGQNFGDNLWLDDCTRVKFRDAGHILGASMIDIRVAEKEKRKKILFSGDLGRADELILREPVQAFDIDYLILESTYGDRLHKDQDPKGDLERVINESIERGGVLLIPAFAIGRTQTLLYIIRELEEEGRIPSIPVYVDSPMAIDATKIFRRRITDLNMHLRIAKLENERVFRTRNISFTKTREQSISINEEQGPAIIISASGMATGGRILHHMIQRLEDPRNTMLFVGYQAVGTRGRTILEGKQEVKIHGRQVSVKAHVENMSGFSGHADYNEILAWLMGFNHPPEKIFLVHGEPEAAASLADKIRQRFGWDVEIPAFGDSYELDLGDC